MSSGKRQDPYRNFRFQIEIDGEVHAGFSVATIPDTTSDVVEYREGNEPAYLRKLPGLTKHGNLTLKHGIANSLEIYNWLKLVKQGKIASARKNITIILKDEKGNDAARWAFSGAWPSKYDAPDLTAKGNDVAIETLEISFEMMERTKWNRNYHKKPARNQNIR
ncbi:MAG: phage tail protein [Candidatus Bathyarchaeota archaeon]|nr:phage tail protein [Candidatus Bathyarchaeota archaeon]